MTFAPRFSPDGKKLLWVLQKMGNLTFTPWI
jgi:Tol biopolymer transport system component